MNHVVRIAKAVVAAIVLTFCLTGASCGGITLGEHAPYEETEPESSPGDATPQEVSVAESGERSNSPGSA